MQLPLLRPNAVQPRARSLGREVALRNHAYVSPMIFVRGAGRRLRGDAEAQVVAVYFLASPMSNLIGAYYSPIATIATDTGIPPKRARDAVARVVASGFAHYDFDAEIVFVPNQAKFEIGPRMKVGDKRRGKVLAELQKLAEHPFVAEFWRLYGEPFELGECPIDGASKGHRRGIRDPRAVSVADPDPSPSPPPDPSPSCEAPPRSATHARKVGSVATRIAEDWQPDEQRARLAAELGIDVRVAAGEFRSYWLSVPDDANALKVSWQSAFESRLYQLAGRRGPKSSRARRLELVQQLPSAVPSWEADEAAP